MGYWLYALPTLFALGCDDGGSRGANPLPDTSQIQRDHRVVPPRVDRQQQPISDAALQADFIVLDRHISADQFISAVDQSTLQVDQSTLPLDQYPQLVDQAPMIDRNIIEGGESCGEALDLFAVSARLPTAEGPYTHRIDGRFGRSNDYNPYEPSGLLLGCSLVYDAIGHEVVYRIDVEPGDELSLRLTLPPDIAGGLYFLDSCERGT